MGRKDDLYGTIIEHNFYKEDEEDKKKKKKDTEPEDTLSRYDVVSAVTVALALGLLAVRIYIMISG